MLQNDRKNQYYSHREEILNSTLHGTALILSFAGMVLMIGLSVMKSNIYSLWSSIIFGLSMVVLYGVSTIYHGLGNSALKSKFQRMDHISIYYLIAGTYTPFLLVNLREENGWLILGIIWCLALLGTIYKMKSRFNGSEFWSIVLYLIMGWLIVAFYRSLVSCLPEKGLYCLFGGGIAYTSGLIFYLWESKEFTHAIWHGFVICGTVLHYFAVLFSCIL